MTTASETQEETLHMSPAKRNAKRPVRTPPSPYMARSKSVPNLKHSINIHGKNIHTNSKGYNDDDSLSSLEDPDDWMEDTLEPWPPYHLVGLTKKDPKDCRVLLSRAQKNSMDHAKNMSGSGQGAPSAPFRKKSLMRSFDESDTSLLAVERLQKLSMSAPNMRTHKMDDGPNYSDVDSNGNSNNQLSLCNGDSEVEQYNSSVCTASVITPTRRRNPDAKDRDENKSITSGKSNSEPRLMLSRQQVDSFSRRNKSDASSQSPKTPQRTSSNDIGDMRGSTIKGGELMLTNLNTSGHTLNSSSGHSAKRRTRFKVRAKAKSVSPTPHCLLEQSTPTTSAATGPAILIEDLQHGIQQHEARQRSNGSRGLLKRSVSRRQLIQKFQEAGIPADQQHDMMIKMGLTNRADTKSAEF